MIDDIANRVRPARARIPADRVHAGSFRGTVVVLGALDLQDRLGGLTSTAAAADIPAGTHAYHGAYRMRRQDTTLGRLSARLNDRTWNLALVVQTGE